MLTKSAKIRLIINAGERNLAQKIADEIITNISAETVLELEYKSFKLCTTIVNGPWLFLNMPKDENEFEFEAVFNHEAFIHRSAEYTNKLKWAHLEIA